MNIRIYSPDDIPAVDTAEVWRYSGHRGIADDNLKGMLDEVIAKTLPVIRYNVCFSRMALGDVPFVRSSRNLTEALGDSVEAVLFAATIGLGVDREIERNMLLSPTKALLAQALGSERIEALCDVFCASFAEEYFTTRRFSAGYGDLAIQTQRDFFRLLDCGKIGLTLNESMLMSPSKSVTAVFGLRGRKLEEQTN